MRYPRVIIGGWFDDDLWKIKTKVKVASEKKTVIFFILVLLLSIPFMVIGAITGIELMPGLPIAAFSTICPILAALFLAYWENRKKGMLALLKRAFDYKRILYFLISLLERI